MDDTNNKVTDNNQTVVSDQQVRQPVSPVQDQKVVPVVTPTPVSLPQKEQAPIISDTSKDQGAELIKPSEPEPNIPQEVKDVGVEAVKETPQLTEEHKVAGIEHAKESTPVSTQPLAKVKLPMSEEEALKIIKTTKNSDSKHWLAVLIEKIYKQLRVMRGKLARNEL